MRRLSREVGLTLEELAGWSGVNRTMIFKIERGERNPTLVVTAKLAEWLDVTLTQLVGVEEWREVVEVPREERVVVRDLEAGFVWQLLSPAFGGNPRL